MEEAPRPAAQLSVAGLEGLRGREAGPGAAGMPGADIEYCVGKGFCTNRCWLQGRVRQVQPGRVSGLPAAFELDDGTGCVAVHVQTLARRYQAEFANPVEFPEFGLREGAYVMVVGRMFVQAGLDQASGGTWFVKAQKLRVLGGAGEAQAEEVRWAEQVERVEREFYSRPTPGCVAQG